MKQSTVAALVVRGAMASCVVAAVVPFGGCNAAGSTRGVPETMDPAVRIAEAQRLAGLAQESADKAAALAAQGKVERAVTERRRAIEYYGRAVGLHDGLGAAWNNLGVLLIEEGRYMDAARALQQAAARSPADPRPHDNLGLIYHLTGYDEQALRHYTDALEVDPNYLNALRGGVLAASRLSRATEQTRDWAERGMLIETDPRWRDIFIRERMQFAAMLEDETRNGRP